MSHLYLNVLKWIQAENIKGFLKCLFMSQKCHFNK